MAGVKSQKKSFLISAPPWRSRGARRAGATERTPLARLSKPHGLRQYSGILFLPPFSLVRYLVWTGKNALSFGATNYESRLGRGLGPDRGLAPPPARREGFSCLSAEAGFKMGADHWAAVFGHGTRDAVDKGRVVAVDL